MATLRQPDTNGPTWSTSQVVLGAILGVSLLWALFPTLTEMTRRWSSDPRYSHGFLVPVFALYLLWAKRGEPVAGPVSPSLWALPLIGAGAALGFAGLYYYVEWFEDLALLPSLAGVAFAAGGWGVLRRALPSIAFLFFMIPLPYRVEQTLGLQLQRVATAASTYGLQTLGLPAVAEGNVILMNEARIGVVEACNGIGMLFMFLAFGVAAALTIRRPLVDKVVIVLSAAPIALVANIARITVTGLLHETVGGRVADAVYHDLAGWLMMPFALFALWVEIQVLSHLLVETPPGLDRPLAMDLIGGPLDYPDRVVGPAGPATRR